MVSDIIEYPLGDMLMSKLKLKNEVKFNTYSILERAIEEGLAIGWRRAHKHTDIPSEEAIKESISREVMNSLLDVLNINDLD